VADRPEVVAYVRALQDFIVAIRNKANSLKSTPKTLLRLINTGEPPVVQVYLDEAAPTNPPLTLGPNTISLQDDASGTLFTLVATGGLPDSYTYSLLAVGNYASFSVDSASGIGTWSGAALAAGTYTITARATNTAGYYDKVIDITVIAAAPPDLPVFDTPAVPSWPYVTLAPVSGTTWPMKVTASTVTGIAVDTQYTNMQACVTANETYAASNDVGIVWNLPAMDNTATVAIFSGKNMCVVGATTTVRTIKFNSGGPTVAAVGQSVVGATSGATATIGSRLFVHPNSLFTWAAGTARGLFRVTSVTGTFVPGESLTINGTADVCTVEDYIVDTAYPDTNVAGFATDNRARTNGRWYLFNLRGGPTDAAIDVNMNATYATGNGSGKNYMFGGGITHWVNCELRNYAGGGPALQAGNMNPYINGQFCGHRVYDCHVWGGDTGATHPIYVHTSHLFFIRSIVEDPRISHALKTDCRSVVYDSLVRSDSGIGIAQSGPGTSPTWDHSRANDIRAYRTVVVHNVPSSANANHTCLSLTRRNNVDYSIKTPHPFDLEGVQTWNSPALAPKFFESSTNQTEGGVSTEMRYAFVSGARASSDTYVLVGSVRAFGDNKVPITLSLSTQYVVDVRVASNSTVRRITNYPTTTDPISGAPLGSGVYCFSIEAGNSGGATLGVAIPNAALVSVYDSANDGIDLPKLNSRYWNRAHSGADGRTYFWTYVNDGTGKLDVTKTDSFDSHMLEECMLVSDYKTGSSTGTAGLKVVSVAPSTESADNNGSTISRWPYPPANRPQGATGAWPDVAGAANGSWKLLNNSAVPYYGRDGTTQNDYIYLFLTCLKNVSYCKGANNTGTGANSLHLVVPAGGPTGSYIPDVRKQNTSGSLVAATMNSTGLGTFYSGVLSANSAAGATTINITMTDGAFASIANGMRVHLMYPPRRGRKQLYVGNVSGTPSGSTVTITPALDYAANIGNHVVFFLEQTGTLPVPPADFGNK